METHAKSVRKTYQRNASVDKTDRQGSPAQELRLRLRLRLRG